MDIRISGNNESRIFFTYFCNVSSDTGLVENNHAGFNDINFVKCKWYFLFCKSTGSTLVTYYKGKGTLGILKPWNYCDFAM